MPDPIWLIDDGEDYPFLAYEDDFPPPTPVPDVWLMEYGEYPILGWEYEGPGPQPPSSATRKPWPQQQPRRRYYR